MVRIRIALRFVCIALCDVKKELFSDVWQNTQDKLMLGFRQSPRPVKGRCASCNYLDICGGNTRTRAFAQTGDAWSEDPGCYLNDVEIGLCSVEQLAQQTQPESAIQFVEV